LFLALLSVLGIIGSSQLSIAWANNNIGPGAVPMGYSIILLALSAMLFFSNTDQPKIRWRKLLEHPTVDGWIFFLLNIAMFVMIYLIGTAPAMVIFCIASLLCLKRQSALRAVVFSVLWVGALYFVFVTLLGVPFETGLLLKLMR